MGCRGVHGSQIKAGQGISACGPGARARQRFWAAGERGRRKKKRGAGTLTCGAERPEREGALGLALSAGLGCVLGRGREGRGEWEMGRRGRGRPKREEGENGRPAAGWAG
jgi:hypothetical protein